MQSGTNVDPTRRKREDTIQKASKFLPQEVNMRVGGGALYIPTKNELARRLANYDTDAAGRCECEPRGTPPDRQTVLMFESF